MPGVQYANQIDMNGFKLTELGAGTAPTDGVNLAQLTAAVLAVSPRGYAQDVGDGVATTFTVTHSLGTQDVRVEVFRKSDGVTFDTDVARPDANTVTVGFGSVIATGSYRVLVTPVP